MTGEYDFGEVRELTRMCPFIPYMARAVHVRPELLALIERAEQELSAVK